MDVAPRCYKWNGRDGMDGIASPGGSFEIHDMKRCPRDISDAVTSNLSHNMQGGRCKFKQNYLQNPVINTQKSGLNAMR